MSLEFQPVDLNQDFDSDGRLVFAAGRLAAVLTRLSEQHEERAGRWYLECGFGVLTRCEMEFETLDQAKNWLAQRMNEHCPT